MMTKLLVPSQLQGKVNSLLFNLLSPLLKVSNLHVVMRVKHALTTATSSWLVYQRQFWHRYREIQ